MQGEIFLIVIHIEHSLGGIGHAPDDRNADLHWVAQTIVDLLAGVVQGHHLERDLLAHGLDGHLSILAVIAKQRSHAVFLAVHVSALAQAGAGGGVDGGAEGVYPVKALSLQGADVITKQGEYQRLLRL